MFLSSWFWNCCKLRYRNFINDCNLPLKKKKKKILYYLEIVFRSKICNIFYIFKQFKYVGILNNIKKLALHVWKTSEFNIIHICLIGRLIIINYDDLFFLLQYFFIDKVFFWKQNCFWNLFYNNNMQMCTLYTL